MNDILINRLNMVGSCITTANSAEHKLVWTGKPPEDFTDDLALLTTEYGAATTLASQYNAATTGAADSKDFAEKTLEDVLYIVSRALASHFKKEGDLTNRAKVDVTKSGVVKLREQVLRTFALTVKGLATEAATHANAVKRGITAARIAELTAAIAEFDEQFGRPRQKLATRGVLRRNLETHVAGLMAAVEDLDDLVIQFSGTEAGDRFVGAWKNARKIVDAGHGPKADDPVPPPTDGGGGSAPTTPGGVTNPTPGAGGTPTAPGA